jgi:hypothetical protein
VRDEDPHNTRSHNATLIPSVSIVNFVLAFCTKFQFRKNEPSERGIWKINRLMIRAAQARTLSTEPHSTLRQFGIGPHVTDNGSTLALFAFALLALRAMSKLRVQS